MTCKMYIAVRDDFPDYMTPTLVAHAVLREHLHKTTTAWRWDKDGYLDWLEYSFRKCVVRVNNKEFNKIKDLSTTHGIVVTESSENKTLGGAVACLTCIVDDDNIPNVLKFAKLWSPKNG